MESSKAIDENEVGMVENQLMLDENRRKHLEKLRRQLPYVTKAMTALSTEVYKDGALSAKIKRLMALAVAVGVGCRNCVLAQTQQALTEKATKEEILETLSVVMTMRGTTGTAESLRVIQLLDELNNP